MTPEQRRTRQGLWVVDIATATHKRVIGVTGLRVHGTIPSWSPSGDQLVLGFSTSGSPHGCFVVDADGGVEKRRLVLRGHSCAWQPARR